MTLEINNKEPKTYIVLGMHQGGTSFLAKALDDYGIDMNIDLKHTSENEDFVELNNRLLASAGGTWMTPPSIESVLAVSQRLPVARTVKKYSSKQWGFKDPRTALTLEAYLPHLNGDDYLIAIFRKPDRIAPSLAKKQKLEKDKALKLTKVYYERILGGIRKFLKL